ncbi:transcription elongation factor [Deinococcus peraridilitoris DSM 19664]|uniref:Transcription elongation factor n=1 Tax=Deinococcus peraridilitoris (strain DSM 19664 / LMG 22246 / CIP 109416 / KR-200) TaxID=937777 RepID=L0A3D7_DEIPD|nr:transcription elongation factor [Deinococcus peraridilitoris DSM 19664]
MRQDAKLTREGYERLERALQREQERLDEARRVVREQLEANENESLGLVEAQQHLMTIEVRIEELEDILARSSVVTVDEAADGCALGATVVLLDLQGQREMRVQLVSAAEASVPGGAVPKISSSSPVGVQLLGRSVGDSFEVALGARRVHYTVKSIEYDA